MHRFLQDARAKGSAVTGSLPAETDFMNEPTGQIEQLDQLLANSREELKRLLEEQRKAAKILDQLNQKIEALNHFKASLEAAQNLIDAVAAGNADQLEKLLASGTDPNSKNDEGDTALIVAVCRDGNARVVRKLISWGADPNMQGADGTAPLIVAVRLTELDSVKALVDAGADLNARNLNGDTPLTNAACWGSTEIVKYLVESGARTDIVDGVGVSAAQLARQHGHTDIAEILDSAE